MYSIKDLGKHLAGPSGNVGIGVAYLRESPPKVVQGRNGAKIWATNQSFALLERMKELEKNEHSAKSAARAIKEEIEKPDSDGSSLSPKVTNIKPEVIQTLEKEIEFLRKQIEEKDRQLEAKDQQIQQLLPGSTDGKGVIRRIWKRIW